MAKWSPKRHKFIGLRSSLNPKENKYDESTPRHIMVKPLKTKDKGKILKAIWRKWHFMYRGILIWVSLDFSSEIMDTRREWNIIFRGLKEKPVNPEFYTQEKYASAMKAKYIFRIKSTKTVCHSVDLLDRNAKGSPRGWREIYQMETWIFRKKWNAKF